MSLVNGCKWLKLGISMLIYTWLRLLKVADLPAVRSTIVRLTANLRMWICHELNHCTSSNKYWLVVSTPLKNMSSSVGIMNFPIYGKIKAMFQTTNQMGYYILCICKLYIINTKNDQPICGSPLLTKNFIAFPSQDVGFFWCRYPRRHQNVVVEIIYPLIF